MNGSQLRSHAEPSLLGSSSYGLGPAVFRPKAVAQQARDAFAYRAPTPMARERDERLARTAQLPLDGPRPVIGRIEAGRPLPPHLRGAVIALGNFDGFHIGHRAVVARAVEMARQRGVAAIVGTFDPHPVDHFKPGAPPSRLSTLEQRQQWLTSRASMH